MSDREFRFFVAGVWLVGGAVLLGAGLAWHSAFGIAAAAFFFGIVFLLKPGSPA